VLVPTKIDGLFRSIGFVYFEAELYKSKTPEYIKGLLVKSGEYSSNIRVIAR
jgi:hypothetical protein